MKAFLRSKRGRALVAVVAALAAAGGAYAYFSANGTGTGSATTAKPASLTIAQVGAGYDSLIPSENYSQDQCFGCAQISELGDDVTLANPGAQQLTSVVVAFRNWGAAVTGVPITFSINNGPNGPVSDTVDASFPAANIDGSPSTANVTFDFSGQGAFVDQEFVYGISFDSTLAPALNVALSNHDVDLSVGSETPRARSGSPQAAGTGIAGDFPNLHCPERNIVRSCFDRLRHVCIRESGCLRDRSAGQRRKRRYPGGRDQRRRRHRPRPLSRRHPADLLRDHEPGLDKRSRNDVDNDPRYELSPRWLRCGLVRDREPEQRLDRRCPPGHDDHQPVGINADNHDD